MLNLPENLKNRQQEAKELAKAIGVSEETEENLIRASLISPWAWHFFQKNHEAVKFLTEGNPLAAIEEDLHLLKEKPSQPTAKDLQAWHQASLIRIACQIMKDANNTFQQLTWLTRLAELTIAHSWQIISKSPPPFTVLALGKLGAEELNFSSDIDLVFVIEKESFEATRLAQRWIGLLTNTQLGAAFYRVDMRLRPFGESGPLVVPRQFLMHYLETEGRDWERLAWMRARPVLNHDYGQEILKDLAPFVYRKYLDFAAIDEIRLIKKSIRGESKNHERHLKLGPGGIREIEFIVQTFQLMFGGRDESFKNHRLIEGFQHSKLTSLVGGENTKTLQEVYLWLRHLENLVQIYGNQQTHELPLNEERKAALEIAMNQSYKSIESKTKESCQKVVRLFEALLPDVSQGISLDPASWPAEFSSITNHARYKKLSQSQQATLLYFLQKAHESALTLSNTLQFAEFLVRKPIYIGFIKQVSDLNILFSVIQEPFLLQQLLKCPYLFEDLLKSTDDTLDVATIVALELKNGVSDDVGEFLEKMNLIKTILWFKIARLWRAKKMNDQEVSAALSVATELLLSELFNKLSQFCAIDEDDFLVVAMGRLGDQSMGFTSDLDLIFLHRHHDRNFDKELSWVRRLMTFITSNTRYGKLFEMDTRLRPSGQSGSLVTSLSFFENYQNQKAEVWEHQALVKARAIWGGAQIKQGFQEIQQSILLKPRDLIDVKQKIAAMLKRVMEHKKSHPAHKYARGGLVEIEFFAQGEALTRSKLFPDYYPAVFLKAIGEDELAATWQTLHAYHLDFELGHQGKTPEMKAIFTDTREP